MVTGEDLSSWLVQTTKFKDILQLLTGLYAGLSSMDPREVQEDCQFMWNLFKLQSSRIFFNCWQAFMQALAVWILMKFKKIVNSCEICQNCLSSCLSYFVHLSDIFCQPCLGLRAQMCFLPHRKLKWTEAYPHKLTSLLWISYDSSVLSDIMTKSSCAYLMQQKLKMLFVHLCAPQFWAFFNTLIYTLHWELMKSVSGG